MPRDLGAEHAARRALEKHKGVTKEDKAKQQSRGLQGAAMAVESTVPGVGEVMDIATLFKGAHTAVTGDPKTGSFMMAMGLGGLAFPMAAGALFRKLGDALTMAVRRKELTPKEAAIRLAEEVQYVNEVFMDKAERSGPNAFDIHNRDMDLQINWLYKQREMLDNMRETPDWLYEGRVPEDFIEQGKHVRPSGPHDPSPRSVAYGRRAYTVPYDAPPEAILPMHGKEIGYEKANRFRRKGVRQPGVDQPGARTEFDFSPEQEEQAARIREKWTQIQEKGPMRHQPKHRPHFSGDREKGIAADIRKEVMTPLQREYATIMKNARETPSVWREHWSLGQIDEESVKRKAWRTIQGRDVPMPGAPVHYPPGQLPSLDSRELFEVRKPKRDPLMTAAEAEVNTFDPARTYSLKDAERELDDWLTWRGLLQENPSLAVTDKGRAQSARTALASAEEKMRLRTPEQPYGPDKHSSKIGEGRWSGEIRSDIAGGIEADKAKAKAEAARKLKQKQQSQSQMKEGP